MAVAIEDIVAGDRYPINAPASATYASAIAGARADLRSTGCAVLRGFVRDDALAVLAEEISARKPATHFSTESVNPYFHTEFNSDYPERHPVNTFIERTSGFIPGDAWEAETAHRRVFEDPALARLLADCLEMPVLHPYADPLAGLTSNILEPGQQFPWHFDTNEFAVTVLVDEADDGGRFEYAPNIRSARDENFAAVQDVLEGARDGVHSLELQPGDLQIFRGRYSLHRVTRVGAASRPRHVTILAYTEQPGVIGRVARTQQLFGRVLPEHIRAEEQRVRVDALLD